MTKDICSNCLAALSITIIAKKNIEIPVRSFVKNNLSPFVAKEANSQGVQFSPEVVIRHSCNCLNKSRGYVERWYDYIDR